MEQLIWIVATFSGGVFADFNTDRIERLAVTPSDRTVAAMLLKTEPGVPEEYPPKEIAPRLCQAIKDVAIEWEILDPRERYYFLGCSEGFSCELNLLRRRYQDLKDAPPVADAARLPSRNAMNDAIQFNREFRKRMIQRSELELDRTEALRVIAWEADRLYDIWDAARDAQCDLFYISSRRCNLKRLKELLGDEAYMHGALPPNVPVWRFTELK